MFCSRLNAKSINLTTNSTDFAALPTKKIAPQEIIENSLGIAGAF